MFTFATVDGPVIVAMVMNCALSVEQQTILAVLECQSSIGAQEELVAVLWMGVSEHAVRVWAAWSAIS